MTTIVSITTTEARTDRDWTQRKAGAGPRGGSQEGA